MESVTEAKRMAIEAIESGGNDFVCWMCRAKTKGGKPLVLFFRTDYPAPFARYADDNTALVVADVLASTECYDRVHIAEGTIEELTGALKRGGNCDDFVEFKEVYANGFERPTYLTR